MHMYCTLRRAVTGRAAPWFSLALAITVSFPLCAQDRASSKQFDARWGKVSVQLPPSATPFPAGEGAVIANSQCLICHSASMVLTQPAMTPAQWQAIINKMRTAYGAPLPAAQIDVLSAYLSKLIPRD
jgi:cytochrome c5